MPRRRQPQSFKAWVIGFFATAVLALIGYHGRIYVFEQFAQRQIEHSEQFVQRMQQQQEQRQVEQQAIKDRELQAQRQAMALEAEQMKARAAEQQAKDAAWSRFYQEPRGCNIWRSDEHMVECQDAKRKARLEFEQQWAAGKHTASQG